jgi:hypothetical protein
MCLPVIQETLCFNLLLGMVILFFSPWSHRFFHSHSLSWDLHRDIFFPWVLLNFHHIKHIFNYKHILN